ncbi:hypothetical protein [Cellulomonas palmilytica]|uniref:hypothetical protein n=1 Tax=Cellulomonas palmilytica TaxID=2608402 RepID=UPI001F255466|nr:hypothetical protein [Cellulomonas palmilytica]UJP40960.1 hypothetical protein F1D97_05705 [Cellulomonas palmilytica]
MTTTHRPTHRRMSRPRALAAVLAAAALLVGGARLASDATDRTTAAWTDDVHVTSRVALGTWTDVFENSCQVIKPDGSVQPNATCSVTTIEYLNSWSVGTGSGGVRFNIHGSATNAVADSDRFRVTVDLSQAQGVPADFQWARAGITWTNFESAHADCSRKPIVTANTYSWAANAGTFKLEVQAHENATQGGCV